MWEPPQCDEWTIDSFEQRALSPWAKVPGAPLGSGQSCFDLSAHRADATIALRKIWLLSTEEA